MATVAEINQRIAVAKAESKRINNERQVNIGKRETLQAQLNAALQKYEADFGVKLTAETLDAEIAKVTQVKEQELSKVEQMLILINEGKYAEAQAIANPESVNTEPTQVVETKVEPTPAPQTVAEPPKVEATPVTQVVPPVQTVAEPPKVEATPVVAPPTPVAPPPTTPVQIEVAPPPVQSAPKMNLSGIDALADFEKVSAPPVSAPQVAPPPVQTEPSVGLGEPPITSFSAILGGSQFAPTGV